MPQTRYISENVNQFQPDYMAYQQTLPQNTSADANRQSLPLGKVQNQLDVVAICEDAITIADGTTFTIKLQESSDNGVSDAWTDITGATFVSESPVGAAFTATPGTVLGRYTVSTTAEIYIKAVIATTDIAAAGKINIGPHRIAS